MLLVKPIEEDGRHAIESLRDKFQRNMGPRHAFILPYYGDRSTPNPIESTVT